MVEPNILPPAPTPKIAIELIGMGKRDANINNRNLNTERCERERAHLSITFLFVIVIELASKEMKTTTMIVKVMRTGIVQRKGSEDERGKQMRKRSELVRRGKITVQ